jgi:hypothetical protein
MSNYVTGPTTFEQLRWSANAFRSMADDGLCIAARAPEFREALHTGGADADWPVLVRYVNQWGCRIPESKAVGVASAVSVAVPYLEPLSVSALEFNDLRCSALDVIERAYDALTEADGVGPTAASAILTALNPQLFVSWGAGIRDAYFPNDRPNGSTYSQFLTIMRMAALSVASDARSNHGIDDPAGQLSSDLGIEPAFSLAKFIDEFNWLTLEREMVFQSNDAVAV